MGFVLESLLSRTGRGRLVPGVILLVLLGLAFWGYRSSRPNTDTDPDIAARSAAGVTVLTETEDYEGAVGGAGLGGTLSVLPGGCLGFGGSGAGKPMLLVFPPGTRVVADAGTVGVRFPDGSFSGAGAVTLHPGDTIWGGTRLGEGPVVVDDYPHLAEHTPKACRGYLATDIDIG